MSDCVKLEYKGRVAIITIDNEKKANALTQDGYYQLATYMREVALHDEVFITILTGKGMIFAFSLKISLTLLRTILLGVCCILLALFPLLIEWQRRRRRNLVERPRRPRYPTILVEKFRRQ